MIHWLKLALGTLTTLALAASCPLASAQNVNSRYDNILWTSSYAAGQQVLVPIPGATVTVCAYPANAVPCTNLATLFVGPTTLGGTSSNPVFSDQFGNFGFWAASGYYTYTVTNSLGQSAGPYYITLGGSGSGPAYALFPSTPGIVFSTSTTASTPATSAQLVSALNLSPSSQLSSSLIPPLPSLIPSTSNLLKGSGTAGSALAAVPGTDYLAPGALPSSTTATTQAVGDNTTSVATDAFVAAALAAPPTTIYSAAGTPLPSCTSGLLGIKQVVSDATSPTFLGTYASGGAVLSPVVCNGANWITF